MQDDWFGMSASLKFLLKNPHKDKWEKWEEQLKFYFFD